MFHNFALHCFLQMPPVKNMGDSDNDGPYQKPFQKENLAEGSKVRACGPACSQCAFLGPNLSMDTSTIPHGAVVCVTWLVVKHRPTWCCGVCDLAPYCLNRQHVPPYCSSICAFIFMIILHVFLHLGRHGRCCAWFRQVKPVLVLLKTKDVEGLHAKLLGLV